MTTKRRTYTDEFKREAVRLWETTDKTAAAIEAELGITPGLLNKWRQRRHSTLGYVSPAAHEAAYYQRQHQLALTECP
jgi:transposase-like protein